MRIIHSLNGFRLDLQAIAVAVKRHEGGASLVEYSVLLGMLVGGSVATITLVGTWVTGRWAALNFAIQNQVLP